MKFNQVVLEAIGTQMAPKVVTTAHIEELLAPVFRRWSLPKGQLQAMTGIVERRFWPRSVSLAQMGAFAVQDALTRCHVPVDALGALVYASVCREAKEPATANLVAARLLEQGVKIPEHAEIFDLSNACLGAMNAMLAIARRIEAKEIRAGVVVVAESAREIGAMAMQALEQADSVEALRTHVATLTGGSGAAAIVLSDGSFSPYEEQAKLLGGVVRNAPAYSDLCRWDVTRSQAPGTPGPLGGPYTLHESMRTDSVELLAQGVKLGTGCFEAFLDRMRWTRDEIAISIGHQVGKTHQDKILSALGLCTSKNHCTYPTLGNTGSAAVVLTLADAIEAGRVNRGDKIALLGIGSGLNCMMIGVQW